MASQPLINPALHVVDALPLLSVHGAMLVEGEVVAAPVGAEGRGQRPAMPKLRTPGLYDASLGGSSGGLHPQDTPRSMLHPQDTPRSMYEPKETPRSMYASAESNLSSLSRLFPSGIRSTPNLAARGTNGEGAGGVTGECVRALEGHEDAVYCCDWSGAEGGRRFVLSGSGDETLRVWDADSGIRSCVRVFKEHSGPVWCCSWSPADGGRRWALSGSRDKTLRVFDVDNGTCIAVLNGHAGSVHACGWSVGESAGRRIVSGSSDKTLRVWDSQTGACEQVMQGHTAAVMCAVWSEADGGCRWVLSGSDDKTLRLWDSHTGACERILEGHSDPVLCCALSTAEGGRRWAISGSWDKNLHLWDCCALLVKKRETNVQSSLTRKLSGHTAPVYCCAWSIADGGARWAVTGAYDETLRVWAVGSGSCMRTLHGHTRWVRSCAWSRSDGGKRWLMSGSRDKTVRVWELHWDADQAPNGVNSEALFVEKKEHLLQRAAALPRTHVLSNGGANHGNSETEWKVEGSYAKLSDFEDMKRSLSSAEQERDVARALLQSKDAEVASLRLRCEELEAELEPLMRSVAQGHRTATDLRQLEAELAVLRELSLGDAVKTRQLYDRLTAEKEAAIAQVRQQARMELEMCVAAARSDAQAEARTAIEQAMSEIAKVSASNDRLAAELGEIHEVKVRCQQLEAETAVKMDAVIHRETQALERLQQAESALADSLEEAARIRQHAEEDAQRVMLQARNEAARQLQELLQQGSQRVEEEARKGKRRDEEREREIASKAEELAQARLSAERDAERIREDAAEAAREVAERMSEAMESEKLRISAAGGMNSPREGMIVNMGSAYSPRTHASSHATRAAPPPAGGPGGEAGDGRGRDSERAQRPTSPDERTVSADSIGTSRSSDCDGQGAGKGGGKNTFGVGVSPSLKWRFI